MVVAEGVTAIEAPVEPLLQAYVLPPEAVSVAVAPVHIIPSLLLSPDVSDTVTVAVGSALTTSEVVAEGRHAGSDGTGDRMA